MHLSQTSGKSLLETLFSKWYRFFGGNIAISPDEYTTKESYIQSLNLQSIRLISFNIFTFTFIFFPLDFLYLSGWPDKLRQLLIWRVVFGSAVFAAWLVLRKMRPEQLTTPLWLLTVSGGTAVGCVFGSFLGPFSEPWMAAFLFAPFISMFFVTSLLIRILCNLTFMGVGFGAVLVVDVHFFDSPFFLTYLAFTLVAIGLAILMGYFYTLVIHQNFKRSLSLRRQHLQLEQRVEERTRQVAGALLTLENSQQDTRQRLARGLQENLGHLLQTHQQSLQEFQSRHREDETVQEELDDFLKELQDIQKSIHNIVAETHYNVWQELPFSEALGQWLAPYKQSSEFDVELKSEVDESDLKQKVTLVLYRVVQEAMTNIRKHAQATKVQISAFREEGCLALLIQDNGKGFVLGEPKTGFGLMGTRERVQAIGGLYELHSLPGQGTQVKVSIPL